MNNIVQCKYCQSPNVIKFGTHVGIQRYWCKDCKRKYPIKNGIPIMLLEEAEFNEEENKK